MTSQGHRSVAFALRHPPVSNVVKAIGTRDILANQPRLSVGFTPVEHSHNLDLLVFDAIPHTPIAHPEPEMRYREALQLHDVSLPFDRKSLYRAPTAVSVMPWELLGVGPSLSSPVNASSHGGVTLGRVLA